MVRSLHSLLCEFEILFLSSDKLYYCADGPTPFMCKCLSGLKTVTYKFHFFVYQKKLRIERFEVIVKNIKRC